MTGWAADYIGTPWVAGVSDCWHFARRVWRDQFGWDVPAVAVCLDAAPGATSCTLSARDAAGARRADPIHLVASGRWV